MEQQQEKSLFDLQLDSFSQAYLMETAKWGKFLGIMGFIGCGLLVIVAIFMGSTFASLRSQFGGMGGMSGGVITIFYLLFAMLYFFPCFYLYNFSVKMQSALRNNDQMALQSAFANQKSCYKFVGILTIVVMSLYLLAIIFGVLFAASMKV
ncbi:MAG: DUF5362 family protein [Sphingobacteriales bacterium]